MYYSTIVCCHEKQLQFEAVKNFASSDMVTLIWPHHLSGDLLHWKILAFMRCSDGQLFSENLRQV